MPELRERACQRRGAATVARGRRFRVCACALIALSAAPARAAGLGDADGLLARLWLLPVIAVLVLAALPGSRLMLDRRSVALGALAAAGGLGELIATAGGRTPWPIGGWLLAAFVAAVAWSFRRGRSRLRARRPVMPAIAEDTASQSGTAVPALGWLLWAFEHTVDAIAVTDLDARTRFANDAWARLHAYEAGALRGHHLSLFHTPDQMRQQVAPLLERALERGHAVDQVEHRKRDGSVLLTRTSFSRLLDDEQQPVGFAIIAHALDEHGGEDAVAVRRELDANAAQAAKLDTLAVLAGGIAHDFNNLLTAVLGNAGLVRLELPEEAPSIRRLDEIVTAAQRAADLSSRLAGFVGETRPGETTLALDELLGDMAPTLEDAVLPAAPLRFAVAETLPPVAGDRAQLRLVITNLVANAADATTAEDTITISAGVVELSADQLADAVLGERCPSGRYVYVEVADTGKGVDRETRSVMFEPFVTTKHDHQGLGLATVLGIVRGHRGAVQVESAPGAGTRVRVLLPTASAAAGTEAADLAAWRGSGTVLVVDNEKIIRDVATGILESHGFTVLTADDGLPAVELYRRYRDEIAIVLLDLTMPGMDGKQALREIHRVDPSARVVMMTGYGEQAVRRGLTGDGLAAFIHKPFGPEQLVLTLRAVLEAG